MQSARVLIQTSLLVSLCAAFPAQSEAQTESAKSSPSTKSSSAQVRSGKKKIASLALPAVPMQATAPRLHAKTASKDIASAARKAVGKTYPSNAFERGLYLKQQGQLKPALLEFIKSAHEDPRQVRAFYEQAQIFKQLGSPKLAKSALEQALAIAPNYSDARTLLVQTHLESGNLIGVANEVGKLFSFGQERPKREAPNYLAYQGAPSAALSIAQGKFPKPSNSQPSSSAFSISPQSDSQSNAPAMQPSEEKVPESLPVSDETSAWLNSALKNAEQPPTQTSTESDTTTKAAGTTSNPGEEKSTSDILASLGIQQPAATNASAPGPKSTAAGANNGGNSAPQAASSVGIIGRMRAKTGQAIDSVQRISKSNMETMKKISHVPHMPASMPHVAVPHMAVPQWMRDVRKHIPFMPAEDSTTETTASTEREGLKEQAASLVTWMKDRLPVSSKEKESRQVAEKLKAAMDSTSKGPTLSPEVAKAIEAKLGIKKPDAKTDEQKSKGEEKAPIYSPEMAKAIEAKLAQARAPETQKSADLVKTPDLPLESTENKGETKSIIEEPKPQIVEQAPPPQAATNSKLAEQFNNAAAQASGALQDISAVFADDAKLASSENSEMDNVKQVLASLGVKSDPESETAAVTEVGEKPKYGLLGNTALKHISRLPIQSATARPSFLDSIWKQAGNTFAHLMPKIEWKLPTIDTAALLNNKQEPSPQMVMATTDPAAEIKQAAPEIHKQIAELSNSSAIPTPVPLDISRILNKLGPAPQPVAMAPVAPPLSASMPIATPTNLDSYIPMPKPQEAPAQKLAALPQLAPQGLTRSNPGSHSGPKSTPQAANTQQLPGMLPPVVQQVWEQAQPLLQPAMKAASTIAESFAPAPLTIPKQTGEITSPVDMKAASYTANAAPAPFSADMTQYFQNQLVPTMPAPPVQAVTEATAAQGLTKTGGRELVSAAREKNGAFTFMKPVIDSDSSFLLGAKQVRTIQPLPAKAPPPKPAPPPEDAVTKRMRYLLENGTSNLRPGEAFMFSEETGEGVLFLPGKTERRKLTSGKDAEEVLRTRRPDIAQPKDLQYSLQLLGKLMRNPEQQQQLQQQQQPAINGPSLDQLMNQMNEGQRSVWGWMKNTFKL